MIFANKIEGLLSAIAIGVASGAVGSILTPTEFRMPRIHFQIGDIGVDAHLGSDGLSQSLAPPEKPNPIKAPGCPAPELSIRIAPPPSLDVLAITPRDPVATLSSLPSPMTAPIASTNSPTSNSNLVANVDAASDASTHRSHTRATPTAKVSPTKGGTGVARAGVVGAHPNASIFPAYPESARLRGEEGTVELSFVVLPSGKTADIALAHSSGFPPLDEAAIRAVRRARFTPATHNGTPVQSKMLQPFEFRLK